MGDIGNVRRHLQTISQIRFVRYLFAAGTATLVDMAVFTLMMFLLKGSISPAIIKLVSLTISYSCGLVTNFWISKRFVFAESDLNTKTQFTRFTIVALVVFVANLGMIQLLYAFIPFPSIFPDEVKNLVFRGFSAGLIAFVSFTIHKFFSFEV